MVCIGVYWCVLVCDLNELVSSVCIRMCEPSNRSSERDIEWYDDDDRTAEQRRGRRAMYPTAGRKLRRMGRTGFSFWDAFRLRFCRRPRRLRCGKSMTASSIRSVDRSIDRRALSMRGSRLLGDRRARSRVGLAPYARSLLGMAQARAFGSAASAHGGGIDRSSRHRIRTPRARRTQVRTWSVYGSSVV